MEILFIGAIYFIVQAAFTKQNILIISFFGTTIAYILFSLIGLLTFFVLAILETPVEFYVPVTNVFIIPVSLYLASEVIGLHQNKNQSQEDQLSNKKEEIEEIEKGLTEIRARQIASFHDELVGYHLN